MSIPYRILRSPMSGWPASIPTQATCIFSTTKSARIPLLRTNWISTSTPGRQTKSTSPKSEPGLILSVLLFSEPGNPGGGRIQTLALLLPPHQTPNPNTDVYDPYPPKKHFKVLRSYSLPSCLIRSNTAPLSCNMSNASHHHLIYLLSQR